MATNPLFSGVTVSQPDQINPMLAGLGLILGPVASSMGQKVGGWAGAGLAGLGQAPGQLMDYLSRSSAAESSNKNLASGLEILGRVPTRAALSPRFDATIRQADKAMISDVVAARKMTREQSRGAADSLMQQFGTSPVSQAQKLRAIENAQAAIEAEGMDTRLGIMERHRNKVTDMRLGVAQIDQKRVEDELQRQFALATTGAQIISQTPVSVADFQSSMAAVQGAFQDERENYLKQEEINAYNTASRRALQGSLWGGGMSMAGSIGGGYLGGKSSG